MRNLVIFLFLTMDLSSLAQGYLRSVFPDIAGYCTECDTLAWTKLDLRVEFVIDTSKYIPISVFISDPYLKKRDLMIFFDSDGNICSIYSVSADRSACIIRYNLEAMVFSSRSDSAGNTIISEFDEKGRLISEKHFDIDGIGFAKYFSDTGSVESIRFIE